MYSRIEMITPEMAAKYLSEQANLPKLKTWEEGVHMPILQEYNTAVSKKQLIPI